MKKNTYLAVGLLFFSLVPFGFWLMSSKTVNIEHGARTPVAFGMFYALILGMTFMSAYFQKRHDEKAVK